MHPTQPAAQANVGTHCSPESQSDSTLQDSPSPPSESETVGLALPPQLDTHTVGPTPGIGARLWVRIAPSTLTLLFAPKLAREKSKTDSNKKLLKA